MSESEVLLYEPYHIYTADTINRFLFSAITGKLNPEADQALQLLHTGIEDLRSINGDKATDSQLPLFTLNEPGFLSEWETLETEKGASPFLITSVNEQGQVAGVVYGFSKNDYTYITWIVIDPALRGKKIDPDHTYADSLYQQVEDFATKQKKARVIAAIRRANTKSFKFFLREGFTLLAKETNETKEHPIDLYVKQIPPDAKLSIENLKDKAET